MYCICCIREQCSALPEPWFCPLTFINNIYIQGWKTLFFSPERMLKLSRQRCFPVWGDSDAIWRTFPSPKLIPKLSGKHCFSALSGFWNYLENVFYQPGQILKLSGERYFPALSWFLNYLEKFVSQPWADSETIWRNLFSSPERILKLSENIFFQPEQILKLSGERYFPALSGFLNYLENFVSQPWADS